MNILAIDTTGKVSTCALLREGEIVGSFEVNIPLTHSETALPMVEDLLRESHFSLDEVDLFAVSAGPGSFTGVRIGVSAVKGMAFALGKPCIGISTLEGLAMNLAGFEGRIVPALDARRGQIYTAIFRWKNKELVRLTEDQADDAVEFASTIPKEGAPLWVLGDGAEILKNALSEGHTVRLAPEDLRLQRASSVARRALWIAEHSPHLIKTASQLEIDYLRLSQAEREREERMSHV